MAICWCYLSIVAWFTVPVTGLWPLLVLVTVIGGYRQRMTIKLARVPLSMPTPYDMQRVLDQPVGMLWLGLTHSSCVALVCMLYRRAAAEADAIRERQLTWSRRWDLWSIPIARRTVMHHAVLTQTEVRARQFWWMHTHVDKHGDLLSCCLFLRCSFCLSSSVFTGLMKGWLLYYCWFFWPVMSWQDGAMYLCGYGFVDIARVH